MSNVPPINPYEPPREMLVVPTEPQTYRGPWRDGDFLVIPVDDCNDSTLPSRCVITGVPVASSQILYAELRYPQSFSAVGATLLCMTWPLSRAAWPRVKWYPIVGFVTSFLVIALWMPVFSRAQPPPDLVWSVVAITAVAVAVVMASKAFDHQRTKPFLFIVRLESGLAWISGAHADFLSDLPPWAGGNSE
jgi:hypothetical protein